MDITQIIEAAIVLLVAVLTGFLIPLLKEKLSTDQLATIKMWVRIAVNAAEQIYIGTGRGKEKKCYVLDFLANKGFKIDEDSIDKLIESSVLELKQAAELNE